LDETPPREWPWRARLNETPPRERRSQTRSSETTRWTPSHPIWPAAGQRHAAGPGSMRRRSSPAKGSGRRPTSCTPRRRRPASSPGETRRSLGTGPRSPAGSATATPRPGGRPTRACPPPAGVPADASGWWWPPPTRRGCPKLTTWYLITNLPHPERRRARPAFTPADLAEVVRLYSLRNWVEQSYKQVKGELGWADFQVRSDRAIRRHWQLVACPFSFCWRAWFAEHPPPRRPPDKQTADQAAVRGEGTSQHGGQAGHGRGLAGDVAPGARLVDPVGRAWALVAGVVDRAPAGPAAAAA
jgi:hypothetical protein